jgi:hypothetical protein
LKAERPRKGLGFDSSVLLMDKYNIANIISTIDLDSDTAKLKARVAHLELRMAELEQLLVDFKNAYNAHEHRTYELCSYTDTPRDLI